MMEYGNTVGGLGLGMGMLGTWLGVFLLPLLIWSLAWKGWALWKAARNDSPVWFVILLVVNTVGILEILYIFLFSGDKTKLPLVKTKKLARSRKK